MADQAEEGIEIMSSIGNTINGVLMGFALASDSSTAENQAKAQNLAAQDDTRRR